MASLGITVLFLRPFLLHPTLEVFNSFTFQRARSWEQSHSRQTFLTWSGYMSGSGDSDQFRPGKAI